MSPVSSSGPLTSRRILRCWSCTEKGNKACQGAGAQALGGAAEGAGSVQPGEKAAMGRPYHWWWLWQRWVNSWTVDLKGFFQPKEFFDSMILNL